MKKPNTSAMLRDPRLLFLLAAGSLAVMTGGVLAPILPEMIEQLPLDEVWAGVLVSTHYLMLAIFSPLLGLLADRFGKLRLLIRLGRLLKVIGSCRYQTLRKLSLLDHKCIGL